jgi:hypothetical protein
MTPHKHHDLIVAWAKGAKIQFKCGHMGWQDVRNRNPAWDEDTDYRIKPEPKLDVVVYGNIEWTDVQAGNLNYRNFIGYANSNLVETDNVKYTFCGETGKLKKAEVIDEA